MNNLLHTGKKRKFPGKNNPDFPFPRKFKNSGKLSTLLISRNTTKFLFKKHRRLKFNHTSNSFLRGAGVGQPTSESFVIPLTINMPIFDRISQQRASGKYLKLFG